MKVESQNSVAKVDLIKQSNTDLQSQIMMLLLSKCAKDISAETLDMKLESSKSESSSKEGAVSTPKSASKKKSSDQIFLEAYMTALQMNDTLKVLAQDTVKILLERSNQDLKDLMTLSGKIEELQRKLSEALSKGEIAELTQKLTDLENQYNQAVSQYNIAKKNYNQNKKIMQDASGAIKDLENKYANIEDKESPEAKAILREISAKKDIERNAMNAMKAAEGQMDKASEVIQGLISNLSALATRYPAFAEAMKGIIAIMESRGSIATAAANLSSDIAKVEQENANLEKQIIEGMQAHQKILEDILSAAETIKEAIQDISGVKLDGLEAKEAIALLNRILQIQTEFNGTEKERKDDSEYLSIERRSEIRG